MANHKSAIKRDRQSKTRQERNRNILSRLKTLIKKVRESAGSDPAQGDAALKQTAAALDRAASKGVIHRNTASRKVSRLTRLVQKSSSSARVEKPKK